MSDEEKRRAFRLPDADAGREVDDEVRFHIERKIDSLVREGWTREAAEEEALRRFGDVDGVKREMTKMTKKRARRPAGKASWETLAHDVRFAFRQLRRNPTFTAVVVVTLALGIGANTAIFSVVDGILLRPLPFPDSHELVNVWSDVTRRGGPDDEWLSYANYHDLRESSRTLGALGAWGGLRPTWTDPEQPRQLLAARVTEGMFSRVLDVSPALGRTFAPRDDEPDAPPVALLSHAFWETAFGADPSVLGRNLTLNERPVEVIGVMPEGFRPPFYPDAHLWMPVAADVTQAADRRGGFSWRAVGRLAGNASLEAARAELGELGARLEREYPESNTDMTFTAVALRDDLVAEARTGLLVLLGAVGFVLLVACVNVANLLMARASARGSELALRSALGAGSGRLTRQLLTESLALALLGGAAGVAVAFLGTDLLVSLAPDGTPRLDEVAVDGRVLVFTAVITVAAGLGFGLVPALRAGGRDLHAALREGGRGGLGTAGSRLRGALVSGQVALALVLLVGAGLLIQSLDNLRTADLGFRPEGVVTAQINFPPTRYRDAESRMEFYRALEEGLDALPGVESVGSTSTVPLTGFDGDISFNVEGRPLSEPGRYDAAWLRQVTPGYFGTMGIEIVVGRGFEPTDGPDAGPVVIVNETLAQRFFPNESPVGRRVNLGSPEDPNWRVIVGVAGDIRNFGIREGSRNAMYLPYFQATAGYVFPAVRSSGPPESVGPGIRRVVAELDPSLAVARVRAMEELVRAEVAPDRFVSVLLSLFAGLALVLAVVGLYGVVSYGVQRRLREMGVRMALGAGGSRIGALVVGRTLALVGVGLVLGIGAAVALSGLVERLLFGVSGTDPRTYAGVALVLGAAGLAAAALPAVRAARLDIVRVLQSE